ncbi:MAG TPA: SCO1664 family protein [Nakamurella sp.]|nr:SCO1664 family protein [Nakamurella sp.]
MTAIDPVTAIDAVTAEVLITGEITVTGRLIDASNVTLLAEASADGLTVPCIYKPVRGERPLWDFPDGTLADRERAAYLVSKAAGWDCVPLTVLRPGPFGPGMVQRWIEDANPAEAVDLVSNKKVPAGWLPVLRAVDEDGSPVALVHADRPALATLAGFDLVVNNADRKGSHVLPLPDGRVLGVDHGLCFHSDDKLRTILWGWAGRPLPATVVEGVAALLTDLDGDLGEELAALLTHTEVTMLRERLESLAGDPTFPRPPSYRTPIPWPPL